MRQAFKYDPKGIYVKAWVPELQVLKELSEIFQPWTVQDVRKEGLGLKGEDQVDTPLLKTNYTVDKRGQDLGCSSGKRGGEDDRGGHGGGKGINRMNDSGRGMRRYRRQSRGRCRGRGHGSSRAHLVGLGRGRGEGGGRG